MRQVTIFDKTAFKAKAQPIFPPVHSSWRLPKELPDLRDYNGPIAIDTETYDPNLLTHGPGWATHTGHIVGFSVAISKKKRWYFPIRHEIGPNLRAEEVIAWAQRNLAGRQPKIGANIMYDVGWFMAEGVRIGGEWIDVQHAEALLDETARSYSLDTLAAKYRLPLKDSAAFTEWANAVYGKAKDQRANIYRCPSTLIGPYGEHDAVLALQIWKKQRPLLRANRLEKVFDLETRLLPVLIAMRFRGVRIDLDHTERVRDKLQKMEQKATKKLRYIVGFDVNVNAAAHLERVAKHLGLPIKRTAKGNPSFTGNILRDYDHKAMRLVQDIRKYQKLRSTFIEGALLGKHVNGRVHTSFNPLRSDSGGAVSGRLSSSLPNLQNIPSRDPKLAPLLRRCFIPEHPDLRWWRGDSSQIEYRFLAHFAVGPGAKELRKQYQKDPNTDYHQAIIDEIQAITGLLLDRKPAKTINFGLIYGMGRPKLRTTLGLKKKKAEKLFRAYHKGVPFAHATFEYYADLAETTGEVRTILGRRSRFNVYEPYDQDRDNPVFAYSIAQARAMFGNQFRRAFTHKALNRVLQGSAADHMKTVMITCWEAGLFEELLPALTVHDELDGDHEPCKRHKKILREIKHTWETCMELRVPILADFEYKKNWGEE